MRILGTYKQRLIRQGVFTLTISSALCSCDAPMSETLASSDTTSAQLFKKDILKVAVEDVAEGPFTLEVISNGKALALNSADLTFAMNGKIQSIMVNNGDYVSKGQALAKIDAADVLSKLNRSREMLNKAQVDLDDRLIDYGFRLKDSAKVPKEVMRMAKVKSGYNNAVYDLADSKTALSKTIITAPFSGRIVNMDSKPYNSSDATRNFCTLIDDSRMKIEFNILETEFGLVKKGAAIEVSLFGQDDVNLKGTVTEINPFIDNNGMIKVTGLVANKGGVLLNGMSVKVFIKDQLANKLYVPRQAVVQRQEKDVVFTYENGKAMWNYVETGSQNSRYIAINNGLKKGQKVIVKNNINLAHNTEVSIDKGL